MTAAMHIVLHLMLCTATVHGAAPVRAVHVELDTRIGSTVVDRDFPVSGDNPFDTIVDLDAPRGEFLLEVDEAKSTCGATQFVVLLPEANRSISMKLTPRGAQASMRSPMLFDGTTPLGFDYAEPTVVLVDGKVACNQPVGDLVTIESQTENDSDSYYVSIFGFTPQNAVPPNLALRLTDNADEYHYVRMNIPLALGQGWPDTANFNVTQDIIDYVVDKPENTYLCPKLYRTRVTG
ncbi:MAG TPA: hypothetical protein VMS32_03290 [Verrucomicrobiae bacterium]|jgi:hypothetical protein|nr:hypothetical protein [Verrucomicrobiae bacterium]